MEKSKNVKVFFSVDPQVNKNFEKYCEDNFINKSKMIEGLMNLLVKKSSDVNELFKNY